MLRRDAAGNFFSRPPCPEGQFRRARRLVLSRPGRRARISQRLRADDCRGCERESDLLAHAVNDPDGVLFGWTTEFFCRALWSRLLRSCSRAEKNFRSKNSGWFRNGRSRCGRWAEAAGFVMNGLADRVLVIGKLLLGFGHDDTSGWQEFAESICMG